jgi:hypothetical protein
MTRIDTCLYILTALAVVNTYLLYRIHANIHIVAAAARKHGD